MSFFRNPRLFIGFLWLLTVAFAFSAGYWMTGDQTKESPPSGPTGLPQANESRADPPNQSAAVAYDPLIPPEAIGSEEREGPDPFARILFGSPTPSDWERAGMEASLLNPQQAQSLVESLLSLPAGPQRNRTLALLLGRMASIAPLEALTLADQIGSLSASESARRRILEEWAKVDPDAALSWLQANRQSTPGRMHSARLESWIEGYASVDPAGAFDHAVGMSEESNSSRRLKRRLIEEVVEAQVAANRLDEALLALQALPTGPNRTEAFRQFYSEWAKQDPVGAARHFLANREDAGEQSVAGLVQEWSSANPEAAAEFVSQLESDDPAYQIAISSLIERWSRYDLEGPAEWLNQLPSSEQTDRAVAVFSVRASEEDPAGAMTWAASIASEGIRKRVMRRVAASWNESDPQGLESFIEENELDEETATRLREARGGRGWGRRF